MKNKEKTKTNWQARAKEFKAEVRPKCGKGIHTPDAVKRQGIGLYREGVDIHRLKAPAAAHAIGFRQSTLSRWGKDLGLTAQPQPMTQMTHGALAQTRADWKEKARAFKDGTREGYGSGRKTPADVKAAGAELYSAAVHELGMNARDAADDLGFAQTSIQGWVVEAKAITGSDAPPSSGLVLRLPNGSEVHGLTLDSLRSLLNGTS